MKALLLLTSCNKLGDQDTGYNLHEVVSPYYRFYDEGGIHVDIVSPNGGKPPLDPESANEERQTDATRLFQLDGPTVERMKKTHKIADVDPANYKIIFACGGPGAVCDLANNDDVKSLIQRGHDNGAIIGAVGHGCSIFVQGDGFDMIKGKNVTGVSNEEEEEIGKKDDMPFLIADKLKELGANFTCAAPWQCHVVADGQIVTGQNPESATECAAKCLELAKAKESGGGM